MLLRLQICEADIRVLKRLGAGASGTVFKGFLFRDNQFVAVKKINIFDKVRVTHVARAKVTVLGTQRHAHRL
jgi:hypothetical protein